MKRFAELIEALTRAESTLERTRLLAAHLLLVSADDAAWSLSLLLGRRPERLVTTKTLCDWALHHAAIPRWLFEESYEVVGDLAETVALLVYRPAKADSSPSLPLSRWMEDRFAFFERLDAESQRRKVSQWWSELGRGELYLLCKLLTGTLRVPISEMDVARSISQVCQLPVTTILLRLAGKWQPSPDFFDRLIAPGNDEEDCAQPYPFLEPSLLDQSLESLGRSEDWLVEWAFSGIRAQLIRRFNSTFLWSQDGGRLTEYFPEICRAALMLPVGTVLDGRIVLFRNSTPLPLALLEGRLKRKRKGGASPCEPRAAFITLDLLEENGKDVRGLPLRVRWKKILRLLRGFTNQLPAPVAETKGWPELRKEFENARHGNLGFLLLRRLASSYAFGPTTDWLEWHKDPMIINTILVNVKAASRADLLLPSEYTLAVWKDVALVPIARIPATDPVEDAPALIRWITQHTTDRFGSTHIVEPRQVIEIAFEGIIPSKRHKSGFTLCSPRITRWRRGMPAQQADTLQCVAQKAHVLWELTSPTQDLLPSSFLFDKE